MPDYTVHVEFAHLPEVVGPLMFEDVSEPEELGGLVFERVKHLVDDTDGIFALVDFEAGIGGIVDGNITEVLGRFTIDET